MDPQQPEREPRPGSETDEALRRLEERLARASEAAERLVSEAAGTAARAAESGLRAVAGGGGEAGAASPGSAAPGSAAPGSAGPGSAVPGSAVPPPSGWQQPGWGSDSGRAGDVELLSQVLGSLRELIPPELQSRLADALRELLMALRALIDWYLERTERRRAAPSTVEDIPIL